MDTHYAFSAARREFSSLYESEEPLPWYGAEAPSRS